MRTTYLWALGSIIGCAFNTVHAGETPLEISLKEHHNAFNIFNKIFATGIQTIIAEYYLDNSVPFVRRIASFMKECPRKTTTLYTFPQIYFLKCILDHYEYTDNNHLNFAENSLSRTLFASLQPGLQLCITQSFAAKPAPHLCTAERPWCPEHAITPFSSNSFNYDTCLPQPCSLNNRGDVLIKSRGLFKDFFTCIFRNGRKQSLAHCSPLFDDIPPNSQTAIWLADNDNLAVLLALYNSKHIPENIFNFENKELDTGLVACCLIDVSQAGLVLKSGVANIPKDKYNTWLEAVFRATRNRLPLTATYFPGTQSLYLETARTHETYQTQTVIQFLTKSLKNLFSWKTYEFPPYIRHIAPGTIAYNTCNVRPHQLLSYYPTATLNSRGDIFYDTSPSRTVHTEPNVSLSLSQEAPILWSTHQNFALLPTHVPPQQAIIWQLLQLLPENKSNEITYVLRKE